MKTRFRIAAGVGAVALVALVWLLVRAAGESDSRAVAPVRADVPTTSSEAAPGLVPIQVRESETTTVDRAVVAGAEAEPTEPADSLDLGEALLLVDVVAAETGGPLAGVRLVLIPERGAPPVVRRLNSARAKVGESPLTDTAGQAEFDCTVGVNMNLVASIEGLEDVTSHVPALAPGECRRIQLRLRTESDFDFYARIVDVDTEVPLPNAVVRRERQLPGHRFGSGDPIRARIGVDGRFRYPGKSWEHEFLSACAPGYAVKAFRVSNAHDAPDLELMVRLSRAAQLDCTVFDRGDVVEGAIVHLETDGYRLTLRDGLPESLGGPKPEWIATTGADGRARIADLPPGTELRIAISVPGREVRREASAFLLDPGELRRMTFELRAGGAIAGRLLRSDGTQIPTAAIWLVPASVKRRVMLRNDQTPAAIARTDKEGSFQFDDVAPGTWWVGPAPARSKSSGGDRAIASLAEVVEVGRTEVTVELRSDVGLYIEGSVLAPDGSPAGRTGVVAKRSDIATSVHAVADASGRFRIGPLVSGRWTLIGGEFPGGDFAPGEPLAVDAGAARVALHADWGARIAGRAVDPAGVPIGEADVWSCRTDGEYRGPSTNRTGDGSFERTGLAAGRYTITVRTRDGRFGVLRDLELRAGDRVEDLTITVEPAPKLTLRNGDVSRLSFSAWLDRAPIEFGTIEPGSATELLAPTGDLRLELEWSDEKAPRTQTVTITRGETKEFVLKRSP